jgi:hypothetical protein
MIMARLKKEILDKGISKLVSRKLLVWLVATIGVPLQMIDGEQWLQISMVYIGSQAAKDFIIEYVKAKTGSQNTPTV